MVTGEHMEEAKSIFQWREHSSPPIKVGSREITLQSKALSVRLPFGGFVWNRPVRVIVEQDGQVEHFPIEDVTRQAMVALALAALAVTAMSAMIRLSRGKPALKAGRA